MTSDNADDRRYRSSATNLLFAMQCFILGMGAYLVLVDLGVGRKPAGNILMLCMLGGLLVWLAPALGNVYLRIKKMWGDESV